MWWDGNSREKYWVEIRRAEGIGTSLSSPNADVNGNQNGWYDLVSQVRRGDVIYHYNARESRFVGRSIAAENAWADKRRGEYGARLTQFSPILASVDLADIRAIADDIYGLRDRLVAKHGAPVYLPFQFIKDRTQLRMMSNYFAKLPRELVVMLFGADGLAEHALPKLPPLPGNAPALPEDKELNVGVAPASFLDPFKAKADSDYVVGLIGGEHRRTRRHEKLVNDCAAWLQKQGLEPGRNAAVDLGTSNPKVIIEAKTVHNWPLAIREAVGQLYEYRFFKVCDPTAGLIFLSSNEVPETWIQYLEKDRGIGVMWPKGAAFALSPLARKYLRLRL